jgi:hypothetical protein
MTISRRGGRPQGTQLDTFIISAVRCKQRCSRRHGLLETAIYSPSFQIDVYLQDTPPKWGILCNGRLWRLYHETTSYKLDSCYEVDLPSLLARGDLEAFKYFYLFFRLEALSRAVDGDYVHHLIHHHLDIDMDGEPPIDKTPFYISKYSIVVLWGAMVLESWGIGFSFINGPEFLKWISLGLWVFGFALLFIGRLDLGNSFRIGSPKESTGLKIDGIYRFSRNPMPSSMGLAMQSTPSLKIVVLSTYSFSFPSTIPISSCVSPYSS